MSTYKTLQPIIEGNNFSIKQMAKHINDDLLSASVENSNEYGRIFGHVIASRNGLAGFLAATPVDLGWGGFGEFSMTAQFESENTCPAASDLLAKWDAVSQVFEVALKESSAESLAADAPFPVPFLSDTTLAGTVSFMLFHETYHIGQLSLILKAATGKGPFDSIG